MAIQHKIAIAEKPVPAWQLWDYLNAQITFLWCCRFQADYLRGLQHKSCGYRRKMFVVLQLEIARPDVRSVILQKAAPRLTGLSRWGRRTNLAHVFDDGTSREPIAQFPQFVADAF